MATTTRRKRISVKEMKFRNDPMVRLYDRTQDWLQERGRPFTRGVAVIGVLILAYAGIYYFLDYRESKAAAAFADAWEKYNARVVETPTGTEFGKYYTDERVKWQEAAEAFERLSNAHSSYYGSIGRYMAGTAYLHFDKDKGVQLLQEVLNKNEQPASDLARLALAEYHLSAAETDQALQLYQALSNSSFVPKQVVNLGLGRAYERVGDNAKAVDAYFEVAKDDRSTPAGADAEKRLSALAPDKIRELPLPNVPAMPE